ncbi:MAG: hypothetical protein HDR04_13715 [Lachnospiraceae bacterium]|nr:hypothetical protein [Lachnospiraceae bacterium]
MGNWNDTQEAYYETQTDLSERSEKPDNCIMPEMPYCPSCKYGSIVRDEEPDPSGIRMEKWICLYDPEQPSVFAD